MIILSHPWIFLLFRGSFIYENSRTKYFSKVKLSLIIWQIWIQIFIVWCFCFLFIVEGISWMQLVSTFFVNPTISIIVRYQLPYLFRFVVIVLYEFEVHYWTFQETDSWIKIIQKLLIWEQYFQLLIWGTSKWNFCQLFEIPEFSEFSV
jgi:hypothetical protein